MMRQTTVLPALILSCLLATCSVFGFVTDWRSDRVTISERLEERCHQEIGQRTLLQHRGIETVSYRREGGNIDVARGRMEARTASDGWAGIDWMCRVDQRSGAIVRVEFGRSTGGSKLMAAASAF